MIIMKNCFFFLVVMFMISCNNQNESQTNSKDSIAALNKGTDVSSGGGSGDCGSLYVFRKGAVVESVSEDATGKEQSKQVSTVVNVTSGGGSMTSEVEMKSAGAGIKEQVLTGKYSCDGSNLYVDLKSLFAQMEASGTTVEGDDVKFPINVTDGQSLPDASYTLSMNQGGKVTKIVSTIRDRKVEGREKVTTPAGTFDCYKITANVDAEIQMPDMDEKTRQMMKEMKKNMPKQHFVMYFDPKVSIVKMEMFSGDNLISRTTVTSIK